MEPKTKVTAENGTQEVTITRTFDLPLALLFKAYAEPEIVAQWMSTKVLKLDNKQHGSWRFQTTNGEGAVVFGAHGTIHEFTPNQRIVRTFEMDNAPFPVQLEFLDFEPLTEDTSKLTMKIIYKSGAHRDQMLALPFAQGLNMAHNRLQEAVSALK